jgi:hypothetical protein
MKFIEEQLVSALRDTPLETDCSVSIKVLEMIGLKTAMEQHDWLAAKHPPRGTRGWRITTEHWEYSLPEIEPAELRPSCGLPPRLSAQQRPAVSRIVVKPLPKL